VKAGRAQITFSVPSRGLSVKINAFLEIGQGEEAEYSISDTVFVTEINEAIAGFFDNSGMLKLLEKAEAPKTGNLNITDISYGSAKLNSSIEKSGNPKFTERGFCYGESKNPAKGSSTCKKIGDAMQSFSLLISGLADSTRYYARAYLENGVNPTQYSEEVGFTTLDGTPSVKFDLVMIMHKTETPDVKFNGTILKPGYPAYIEKGFCYGAIQNPAIGNSTCKKVEETNLSFSLYISNLPAAASYNVRAYVDNGVHPVQYSNKVNFKTSLKMDSPLVDSRDEKTYETASFGSYTWMIDDLKYNSSTGLYTRDEAIKICPGGWHLPSNSEWDALSTALGDYAYIYFSDATGTYWWSTTHVWYAWYGDLERRNPSVSTYYVRCVKD